MKPVNIFALTRVSTQREIQMLEGQMSHRERFLIIKEWEIDSIKCFCDNLYKVCEDADDMDFFYSFQIPKLGKEFDLLRISDECIVNIELKSSSVPDEQIQKQLMLNRYYLVALERTVRSYTYISGENRLVRLTNSNRLVEAEWKELVNDLKKQENPYIGDIENLFSEINYIISPLNDPERFLRKEYFLTSQQKDIKTHILKNIKSGKTLFQGFTGLPGTGKTMLLFDIAMEMSLKEKVCVFHFGIFPDEMERLNERLKRVDFVQGEAAEGILDMALKRIPGDTQEAQYEYEAILIDEGHRMSKRTLEKIKKLAVLKKIPVVISYDCEDAVSIKERKDDSAQMLAKLPNYIGYKLTNRLRTNSELSSFINCALRNSGINHRKLYPSVKLVYANNEEEKDRFLKIFSKRGYMYISEDTEASCREFEKVVMVIDKDFAYDKDGFLRDMTSRQRARNLFQGLNRAKTGLAIIVYDNEKVFDYLLYVVQR